MVYLLDVVSNPPIANELSVALDVIPLDVTKQTAALTNEHEQASTCVVVLRMRLHVLSERANPLGEQCYLNRGRAGVVLVLAKLSDELGFTLL